MKSIENVKIEGIKLFNNLYDYSNISLDKEIVENIYCTVCQKHFNKRMYDFLKGSGCKKCGDNKRNFANRLDIKTIIEELSIKNVEKYDYSNIDINNYKNKTDKVLIFCKKCKNDFKVSLKQHIDKNVGCKCQKCLIDKRTPIPEILERFFNIHSDKYEYYIDTETYKTNYEGKRVVPYKLTIETHINRVMIWCNNDQYLNGSYIDNLGLEKFIRKAKIERLLCH